jgi:hypothetical protein
MARPPYDGHADFYLLDLWQQRGELDQEGVAALRGEMLRRGLVVSENLPAASDPYRAPPAPEHEPAEAARTGPPCPTCARPTVEGKVGIPSVGAHCTFTRDGGGGSTIAFRHTDSPAALLCEDCGTVVVKGRFA